MTWAAGRRTRRQLLAGGTGALAAVLTAEALARPTPALAGTDGDVVLGAGNTETNATTITNTAAGVDVLDCNATGGGAGVRATSDSGLGVGGGSNSGTGVFGACKTGDGVGGLSVSGNGVSGTASSATANGVLGTNKGAGSGVLGQSSTGAGVVGTTGSASASGVSGQNTGGGAGVTGTTNSGADIAAVVGNNSGTGIGVFGGTSGAASAGVFGDNGGGGTGVFGLTGGSTGAGVVGTNTGAGSGVFGESSTGAGVVGTTGSVSASGVSGQNTGGGAGVTGQSDSGDGVSGISKSGDAVSGTSDTGHAFFGVAGGQVAAVAGKNVGSGVGVRGECAAGLGVLAIGGVVALEVHGPAVFTRSGLLTVAAGKSSATQTGVALTSASLVLATMQQDRTGVYVRSAVPNIAGSSFTVHLSKAVSVSMTLAWFVVN